jgi:hypothetical protein
MPRPLSPAAPVPDAHSSTPHRDPPFVVLKCVGFLAGVTMRNLTLACLISPGISGCSKGLQEKALRQQALDMCGTMTHEGGDSCRAEVERRLPACSGRFLARKIDSERFADCLGFLLPAGSSRTPLEAGRCATPHIAAKISVSLAKSTPWEGSVARVINGQTHYVSSSPAIGPEDVLTLRLEDLDGDRVVSVEISEEAARRLEATTQANVGESMLLTLNGSEVAAKIASAIPGPKLVIPAPGARIQDLCTPPAAR